MKKIFLVAVTFALLVLSGCNEKKEPDSQITDPTDQTPGSDSDQKAVQSISLSISSFEFTEVGQTVQLKVTVTPSDAVIPVINWLSSNTKVATVSDKGLVTCNGFGNSIITVKVEDKSAQCNITAVEPFGTVTDICGIKYNYVKIGTQIWMAENMRCNKYDTESERKGETIRELTSAMSYKAYYFDDSKVTKEYGYLYNWAAVVGLTDEEATKTSHYPFESNRQGICPNGWHVPTAAEWDVLAGYIGSEGGKKLKSSSGWLNDDNGTDAYSFTALPAGSHAYGTEVQYVGEYAKFWTASPNSANHDYINMRYVRSGYDEIGAGMDIERAIAISLRCVRN